MAKTVGQLRYYGEKDPRNFPAGLGSVHLYNGNALKDYYPITQLGIQTVPGAKLTLNKDKIPVTVGVTGIYELNIDGLAQITDVSFASETLNLIKDPSNNFYLIIDFISDKEG